MSEENDESDPSDGDLDTSSKKDSRKSRKKEKQVIKEEIEVKFTWYIFSLSVVYYVSFLVPGILFMLYVLMFFLPRFLEVADFFALFLNLDSLLAFLLIPIVIGICYVLHLVLIALVTRLFWNYTETTSPSKEGIIPRNVKSRAADFYHVRSFLIKYPKNKFVKGLAPWLSSWMFNIVGASKIGKGTTIEEQVVGDRFVETGKNCYVGVNSALSTHFVEGTFGNIVYFKIKLGDNVTLGGFNNIAPGCELNDNSYILPLGACTKHNKTKGDNYYFGMPIRRIFKKKLQDYLKVTPEDLKRAEGLKQKQMESKQRRES